jgi:hypothetical protein
MDQDFAELTEVVEHDASGRIKKFIRTRINRNDVVALRAKARVAIEEAKAAELAKDVDRLIERAHEPPVTHAKLLEKARKPSALPAPAPVSRHAPAPAPTRAPQRSPSPAIDRRTRTALRDLERLAADVHEETARNVALRKQNAELRKQVREAIASLTTEVAAREGESIGRTVMSKVLELVPADTPPTATVTIKGEAIQGWMQQAYDQLCAQDYYPTVATPEYAKAFTEAFMRGVHEAKHQFETTPRHLPSSETIA